MGGGGPGRFIEGGGGGPGLFMCGGGGGPGLFMGGGGGGGPGRLMEGGVGGAPGLPSPPDGGMEGGRGGCWPGWVPCTTGRTSFVGQVCMQELLYALH